MAEVAPWEEAPTKAAAKKVEQAPWQDAPQSFPTIEEMHPAITVMDRLKLEALANDPAAAAAYLKKEHPELEVQTTTDGGVILKDKEEKNWRVLDPQTGVSLTSLGGIKEAGYDLVGNIPDIGIGLGSAAVGTVAGIAATAPTAGFGTIPAAMGAAGATAGAGELAKQRIGRALGIPQGLDYTKAAISTAGGAAGPLLFGTGATAAQMAGKSAAAAASQRGVLGRAYDAVANTLPSVGNLMSGIPESQILARTMRPSEVKKVQDAGVLSKGREIFDKLRSYFGEEKAAIGAKMNEVVENATTPVDISAAKKALMDARNAAQKAYDEVPNQTNADSLKNLDNLFNENFVNQKALADAAEGAAQQVIDPITGATMVGINAAPEKFIADQVSASQAQRLKDALNESADMFSGKLNQMGGRLSGSKADKNLTMTAQKASQKLSKALGDAVPEMKDLNQKYAAVANTQKLIQQDFKTPRTTAKTLSNLSGAGKQDLVPVLKKIDADSGMGILDSALLMQTAKTFTKPSKDAISSGGTTSTSRSNALGLLGSSLGFGLGIASGGNPYLTTGLAATLGYAGTKAGSPAAIGLYGDVARNINVPIAAARNMGLGLSAPAQIGMQYAAPSAWDAVAKREGIGK